MKKTKLLAATAMLLLTSCSPKVVTHIVRTYPNPVPADTVFAGEVGLSGEIRAVSRIEQRISEAEKLGFKRIFVPLGNKKGFTRKATHIEVAFVSRIADICRSLFG